MTIANDWLWVVFDNLHALGEQQEALPALLRAAAGPCLSVLPMATECRQQAQLAAPPAGWGSLLTDAVCVVCPAGRIDEQFEFKDPRNMLVGPLGDDSQFEVRRGRWPCCPARHSTVPSSSHTHIQAGWLCCCRQQCSMGTGTGHHLAPASAVGDVRWGCY